MPEAALAFDAALPAVAVGRTRRALRMALAALESPLDRAFGPTANPWRHLGGLGYLLFWIVAVTGIYIYIGFDTRVAGAWDSVERLSSNAFPLGALTRSLHRYASDAFVLVMLLHLVREWVHGRYAHFRRFSWTTGVLVLWLGFASGIGGFWLVWDRVAQYSLIATLEWFDVLPLIGGTLVHNVIGAGAFNDRLFSLLIFLHIGLPLALLAAMWVHVQRLTRPMTSPPRTLALGTLAALVVLALALPVKSTEPADLSIAPQTLPLDWFYLAVHAIADATSPVALWGATAGFTLLLLALPWWSSAARAARPLPAVVTLSNCNGCARCFADCPYAAVTMQPRTDSRPHLRQAVVDPALCAGCGICAGACPSSTPFRSVTELATGIDLPQASIHTLRADLDVALARFGATTAGGSPRIIVFGCVPDQGGPDIGNLADATTATLSLVCAAQLPPSFIEYALRAGADGVLVTGCRDGDCAFRLGNRWTEERIAGARAPRLRALVPAARVRVVWAGSDGRTALAGALASFRADLGARRPERHSLPKRKERNRARAGLA